MAGSRRVTSHDVAAAAGVSRTTVSFVLNRAPNQSIPESTRSAVLEAARSLGYTPSAAARTLRAGSSRLVLCVAPDWQPSALMDAGLSILTERLHRLGYATVIAKSAEDSDSLDILWESVSPAVVVAMFDLPGTVRERVAGMGIPVVESFFHSFGTDSDADDMQVDAGRVQAEYAIERGARRLVFVSPPDDQDAEIHADRYAGVSAAAAARGLPRPELVVLEHGPVPSAGETDRILRTGDDGYTIVCCYNDEVALGVLGRFQARGMQIPEDVGVIGVDDDPMSALVSPALTTVRFDVPGHMERVAERVAAALDLPGASVGEGRRFTEIVARESA